MTDKAKQRRRALANQLGVSRRSAANVVRARKPDRNPRGPQPKSPPSIQIVPRFDPAAPKNRTKRLATGAYQDPIRTVEIINGDRNVVVWVSGMPEGRLGWRPEVRHRTGPWPLTEAERSAFERWLEEIAAAIWPALTLRWPLDYAPFVPGLDADQDIPVSFYGGGSDDGALHDENGEPLYSDDGMFIDDIEPWDVK